MSSFHMLPTKQAADVSLAYGSSSTRVQIGSLTPASVRASAYATFPALAGKPIDLATPTADGEWFATVNTQVDLDYLAMMAGGGTGPLPITLVVASDYTPDGAVATPMDPLLPPDHEFKVAAELASGAAEIARLSDEVVGLQAALEAAEGDAGRAQAAAAESAGQVRALMAAAEDNAVQFDAVLRELDSVRGSAYELREQLEAAQRAHTTELEAARQAAGRANGDLAIAHTRVSSLESDCASLRNLLGTAAARTAERDARVVELEGELKVLRAVTKAAQAEASAAEAAARNAPVEINAEWDLLNVSRKAYEADVAELAQRSKAVAQLQAEVNAKCVEYVALKGELEARSAELAEAEAAVARAAAQAQSLEARAVEIGERESQFEALRAAELAKLSALKMEAAEEAARARARTGEECKEMLRAAAEELKERRRQFDAYTSSVAADTSSALSRHQELVDNYKAEVARLDAAFMEQAAVNNQLLAELDTLRSDNARLRSDNDSLTDRLTAAAAAAATTSAAPAPAVSSGDDVAAEGDDGIEQSFELVTAEEAEAAQAAAQPVDAAPAPAPASSSWVPSFFYYDPVVDTPAADTDTVTEDVAENVAEDVAEDIAENVAEDVASADDDTVLV